MKKIVNFILSIPYDKLLHFFIGFLIVAIFYCILPQVQYYAIVFAIIAGLTKDLYDYKSYGTFDWLDVLATALGGLLMQIVIYLRLLI